MAPSLAWYSTPSVDAIRPVPGERPYAGWLYVAVGEQVGDTLTSHELRVAIGVTGRPSLAEAAATAIHEIAGFREFHGWDNQLAFEPGIFFLYDYRLLLAQAAPDGNRTLAIVPVVGSNLGTVRIDAHVGTDLYFGVNVPHPWMLARQPRAAALYVTGGIQGSIVARDLFLDGNTFTSSISVDKKTAVFEHHYGLTLRVGRVHISYSVSTTSREYTTQAERHTYSTIGLKIGGV